MYAMLYPAAPSPGADPESEAPPIISNIGLALSALFFGMNILISMWLQLGLHAKLVISACRCVVQLLLLGLILVPIFKANAWWLTVIYSLFMLLVAAAEAVSRAPWTYNGMMFHVLVSLGVAAGGSMSFGLRFVVKAEPWWGAQYLIPMLGMMLGNACSGVAVGLSAVLDELSTGKNKVELLMSLGASRMEATRAARQRAIKTALTPLVNQMNVVGIVSIPGMMTGQILGGSDPSVAARYQIIIMFLIGSCTGLATVATVYVALITLCDECHRLRTEKLHVKDSAARGAIAWATTEVRSVWRGVKRRWQHLVSRMKVSLSNRREVRRYYRVANNGGNSGRATEAAEAGEAPGSPLQPLLSGEREG